jgi:drug/metabolite transporter (DMT)-like permease
LGALLIILGRVIASPLVNLFQKKLTDKNVSPELIVTACYLFFVLLSIPVFIFLKPFYLPQEFWMYIGLLGVFDVFGNMFLVKSLKTVDLSVFGPLNSYKPVFALLFSVVLLNEIPSLPGIIGVIIIIIGSYLLGYRPGVRRENLKLSLLRKGIVFRFLAIILTSIAAVFSKKAIILSSPLITLVYWSLIGLPFSMVILFRLNSNWKTETDHLKHHLGLFVLLFLSFLCLQFFTLLTFEKVFVGYSLALFQLSSVISVIFGFLFFKERNLKYRLLGSIIMVVGSILIAVLS